MVVQHNLSAMNANRYLGINNSKLSKSLEKLSSGYAINRAGDNAAGLAVSEKMRSQIAGMTQAVKNAQDGISMVQTFEGALTETDSILQRMKTLADQMANGTYDDPVDRTAAQQEFLQLNDELDQIADTDFNGVVTLNGGQMADGLKVNEKGEFNYKEAKAASSGAEAIDVAKYTTTDRTTDEAAGAILDNSDYNADAANALWDALGLKADDVKELNITWQKQGDTWKAVAATSGAAAQEASTGTTTTTTVWDTNASVAGTGTGAFTVTAGKQNEFNQLVADEGLGGKTLTMTGGNWQDGGTDISADLKAKLDAVGTFAGANTDTITFTAGTSHTDTNTVGAHDAVPASEKDITKEIIDKINSAIIKVTATDNGGFKAEWKDADGNTYDVNNVFGAYKAAEGDYITNKFTNTNDKSYAPTNIGVAEDSLKVTLAAPVGGAAPSAVPEGTITVDLDTAIKGTDTAMTQELSDALDKLKDLQITATGDNTFTAVTCDATSKVGILADGTLQYWDGTAAKTLGTVTFDSTKLTSAGWKTGDKVEFKLNVDDYKFVANADVKANSIETSDIAKKAMKGDAVSVSNAFKNSEAIMTYKDSIILQAGARTKDAVEFTFAYASDAIGDLKANMNCSSRADGLNTAGLNLNTQADANYAIDKIDQAINKVSLVRGTFGAIQNRLEHKIDNLNVSVENLTSAESQIRDTNMPQEMMNFTKQQILAQASQSMLAQANQLPQGVLSLLQ